MISWENNCVCISLLLSVQFSYSSSSIFFFRSSKQFEIPEENEKLSNKSQYNLWNNEMLLLTVVRSDPVFGLIIFFT